MLLVVSETGTGKAYALELKGPMAQGVTGRAVGDTMDGGLVGLSGYTLRITGGSDKDGFPLLRGLPGAVRKRLLITGGIGFRKPHHGLRIRRTLRGREVTPDTSQVNAVVVTAGSKPLAEIVPPREGKKKEKKAKGGATGPKAPKGSVRPPPK